MKAYVIWKRTAFSNIYNIYKFIYEVEGQCPQTWTELNILFDHIAVTELASDW